MSQTLLEALADEVNDLKQAVSDLTERYAWVRSDHEKLYADYDELRKRFAILERALAAQTQKADRLQAERDGVELLRSRLRFRGDI